MEPLLKFSFDKKAQNSSSTLENYRLTLEFASNPTWYAVQALPAMTTPDNENVISWFAAYTLDREEPLLCLVVIDTQGGVVKFDIVRELLEYEGSKII